MNNMSLREISFALKEMKETRLLHELLDTFKKHSTHISQFDEIGFIYKELKEFPKSVECLLEAKKYASMDYEHYALNCNLSKMLNFVNDPEQSLKYSSENLEKVPNDPNMKLEFGFSNYLLGNNELNEKILHELINTPDIDEKIKNRAHYNLAAYHFERNEFKKAIKNHIEYGKKLDIIKEVNLPNVQRWSGMRNKGKTIIICAQGGIGDELVNLRFMQNIKNLGMKPVWLTSKPSIVEVANRNGFMATTDFSSISLKNTDYCMMFELPYLLDVDFSEVWNGPYLKPSVKHIRKWKKILPEGKKICIKWFGNKEYDQDIYRSIPENVMKKINKKEAHLISVQLEGLGTLDAFDCAPMIESIEDTLAIITLCDFTVSSCTSVAHMSGALGTNTIVCPPIATYYIWMGRSDGKSHWYGDNLHVVRQKEHKNWDKVMERVNVILENNL